MLNPFIIGIGGVRLITVGTKYKHVTKQLFQRVPCYEGVRYQSSRGKDSIVWIKDNTIHLLHDISSSLTSINSIDEYRQHYRGVPISKMLGLASNCITYAQGNRIFALPINPYTYEYLLRLFPESRVSTTETSLYDKDCANWRAYPKYLNAICFDKAIKFFFLSNDVTEVAPAFEVPLNSILEFSIVGNVQRERCFVEKTYTPKSTGINVVGGAAGAMVGGAVMGPGGAFLGAMAGSRMPTHGQVKPYKEYDEYDDYDDYRVLVLRTIRDGNFVDFIFDLQFYDYLQKVCNEPCPVIKFSNDTNAANINRSTSISTKQVYPVAVPATNKGISNVPANIVNNDVPANTPFEIEFVQFQNDGRERWNHENGELFKWTAPNYDQDDTKIISDITEKIADFLNLQQEYVIEWLMGQDTVGGLKMTRKEILDLIKETLYETGLDLSNPLYKGKSAIFILNHNNVISSDEIKQLLEIKKKGSYEYI